MAPKNYYLRPQKILKHGIFNPDAKTMEVTRLVRHTLELARQMSAFIYGCIGSK